MSLLVKLSLCDPIKTDIWIRAHLIMGVQRAADNPMITLIGTSVMTNKGPMTYQSLENPETIAEAVNNALMAKPDTSAN